jgi:hypothetical protein
MNDAPDPERDDRGDTGGRPATYQKPVLITYGPVASMTHSLKPTGTTKDGGPNNTKS